MTINLLKKIVINCFSYRTVFGVRTEKKWKVSNIFYFLGSSRLHQLFLFVGFCFGCEHKEILLSQFCFKLNFNRRDSKRSIRVLTEWDLRSWSSLLSVNDWIKKKLFGLFCCYWKKKNLRENNLCLGGLYSGDDDVIMLFEYMTWLNTPSSVLIDKST